MMENEILKLIHKYKQMLRDEPHQDRVITIDYVISDLQSLLNENAKNKTETK